MADVTTNKTVADQMQSQLAKTQGEISKAYDTGLEAQKKSLLDAYNQNTAAQAQQGQNIRQNAAAANYDIGVQNDRNDRNLTQFADVRGVNTGLGSQHQLNLGNARANAVGAVQAQQQAALAENERQTALLGTNYQNMVESALKDNDYRKAASLLDDYNNQKNRQDQQAQILASFGNFGGYEGLYGADTANAMQGVWNAQNPDAAYRTGKITPQQYRQITGQWPAGYTPPSSGGGYGYYYGGPSNDDNNDGNSDGLAPDVEDPFPRAFANAVINGAANAATNAVSNVFGSAKSRG